MGLGILSERALSMEVALEVNGPDVYSDHTRICCGLLMVLSVVKMSVSS